MEELNATTVTWTSTEDIPSMDVEQTVLNIYRDWYPAIVVWMYMYVFGGIPGNFLLLLGYIKDPGLHTPTNSFICSQSAADLATCLTSQMFIIMNYTKAGLKVAITNKAFCLFALSTPLFSLLTSLTSLLILSIERFIAVVFPYHYYSVVTDRSARIVITAKWVTILVIMIMPVLGWNVSQPGNHCMSMKVYPREFFMFLYLLPSLLMIISMTILHTVITVIAVYKSKMVPQPAVNNIPLSTINLDNNQDQPTPDNEKQTSCFGAQKPKKKTKSDQNYKTTKTFLKVVTVFYLSWLPYIILTTLTFLNPSLQKNPEWFVVLHEVCKALLALNGVCNPFIYAKGNFRWNKVLWKVTHR